jgi:hypothetical protein
MTFYLVTLHSFLAKPYFPILLLQVDRGLGARCKESGREPIYCQLISFRVLIVEGDTKE